MQNPNTRVEKSVLRKKHLARKDSLPLQSILQPRCILKTPGQTTSYQVLPILNKFTPTAHQVKSRSKSIKNYQTLTNLSSLYTTFSSTQVSTTINYEKGETPKKRSSSESHPPYSKISKPESSTKPETISKLSNYLSLDDFRPQFEELSPRLVFDKLKQSNKQVKGLSKWFFGNGTYEWRECVVEKFDQDKELFQILWPNGKFKWVSKVNLRFDGEEEGKYERNIEIARKNRMEVEVSLRYDALMGLPGENYPVFTTVVVQKVLMYLQGKGNRIINYRDADRNSVMGVEERVLGC